MRKLENNQFTLDKEPLEQEKVEFTEEFIEMTLKNYQRLLEAGLIDEVTKKEKNKYMVKK